MTTLRMLAGTAAIALLAGPAAAVTVENTSKTEFTIGIDYGNDEKTETVPAGKSVKFDCKDGCGVTGPWGFSWMASGDDTFKSNGTNLITPR